MALKYEYYDGQNTVVGYAGRYGKYTYEWRDQFYGQRGSFLVMVQEPKTGLYWNSSFDGYVLHLPHRDRTPIVFHRAAKKYIDEFVKSGRAFQTKQRLYGTRAAENMYTYRYHY